MAKVITLSGLGKQQSCCRWINMGGYWAWVCGPGICRGGDAAVSLRNGTARITATNNTPSLLGANIFTQAAETGETTGFKTGFDFGSWIKDYWYIPAAVAAFFILKK